MQRNLSQKALSPTDLCTNDTIVERLCGGQVIPGRRRGQES